MLIQVRDYVVPLATPGKPCSNCGKDAKAETKRGLVCWHCYLDAVMNRRRGSGKMRRHLNIEGPAQRQLPDPVAQAR